MATFRKPPSKSRAALESSTALPPAGSDFIADVGEQAAKIADLGKTPKSGRKVGAPSKPPIPADAGIALAPPDIASPDVARPAVDLVPPVAEVSVAAADAIADTTEAVAEIQTGAAVSFTQSVDSSMAEVESMAKDVADQASHASADAIETVTRLATETVDETADMTATALEVAAPLAAVATAIERANPAKPADAAEQTLGELNARLADLFRDYLEDSLAFMAAITAVRSVPEALTVNQQHFQRRLNAITTQSRELTLLAGKLAAQAWRPFTPAAFR